MDSVREPIGVIGTGYVGLVTAAGFAELGGDVYCVDIDAGKIEGLRRGEIPIYEPGLADMVARNAQRMHFSTTLDEALEHARLLFVAVGTPPTYSGDADLSAVHAVVDAMPPSDRHALVMKSTVPVGTGRSIQRIFAEKGKTGFRYVSCPEFLKEGSAVKDFLRPDRVVVGDDGDWAGDAVVDLYAPLGAPLVRTDVASAEMVKLASNAFLATKISFINEIANVCEETGANVMEVARGMGLDDRIGPKFLQPGIGFGGSCFAGEETVLARHRGQTKLLSFEALWERLEEHGHESIEGMIAPEDLEVLSWVHDEAEPRFMPVMLTTRREYEGDLLEVRTKMGRRLRTTPDHPFVVSDGRGGEPVKKLARDLTTDDWLPIALGRSEPTEAGRLASLMGAAEAAELHPDRVIVRVGAGRTAQLVGAGMTPQRRHDVRRSGTLRLSECAKEGMDLRGTSLGTARNGAYVTSEVELDARFWRVVGLYLAEGHASLEERGTGRIHWSFHPYREDHLVDEVLEFWRRHGIDARATRRETTHQVTVQSRLAHAWWTRVLGLGSTCYGQRLPDMLWDRPAADKWALLSGLWEGDGSWSLINGGPSVILELGTVSRELADGVHRLLAELGIVASQRTGRTAKSTIDTYWLRIAGADQIERSMALVPERDRRGVEASVALQAKRIKPTGYRTFGPGPAWARVTAAEPQRFRGQVYSLEVPGSHTVVTTNNLILGQCFPKDVSALKQLAGNSGYHFQLLNAVIEVNELQKRRVISKLQKHLGSLVGRRVALLGLAFKPETDDMREASSLVLAARLLADGAAVSAYDPVAEEEARTLMPGVQFADGALEAVEGADAVVLVTEWKEFGDLDWQAVRERMTGDLVVDGRNALDAAAVRGAGLAYDGVGIR